MLIRVDRLAAEARDSVPRQDAADCVPRTFWPHAGSLARESSASKRSSRYSRTIEPFDTPKPEPLHAADRPHRAPTPGDVVLDCFAGSGTTAAVAQKMGRRWIAVESLARHRLHVRAAAAREGGRGRRPGRDHEGQRAGRAAAGSACSRSGRRCSPRPEGASGSPSGPRTARSARRPRRSSASATSRSRRSRAARAARARRRRRARQPGRRAAARRCARPRGEARPLRHGDRP